MKGENVNEQFEKHMKKAERALESAESNAMTYTQTEHAKAWALIAQSHVTAAMAWVSASAIPAMSDAVTKMADEL
jgi:hypothetical protein